MSAGNGSLAKRLAALDPNAYRALIGYEIGSSGWLQIDQTMIDGFASAILGREANGVDPVLSGGHSRGAAVAHPFLTLSLLSALARQVVPPVAGAVMSVNYGIDKLRFLAPVPAGARIRGHFTLQDLRERRAREWLLVLGVRVEIEGSEEPALTAQWLGLQVTS